MVEERCWRWTGKPGTDGYGRITIGSKVSGQQKRVAHRVLWEMLFVPVPDGLDLDHECHNEDEACPGGVTCTHRLCVSPFDLRIATRGANLRGGRGIAAEKARQTECIHGHPLIGDNLKIRRNGTRACRACMNQRRAQYPHYR